MIYNKKDVRYIDGYGLVSVVKMLGTGNCIVETVNLQDVTVFLLDPSIVEKKVQFIYPQKDLISECRGHIDKLREKLPEYNYL